MTDLQQRAAAKKFVEYWRDKGRERGECQPFWLSLLRDVYGVNQPEQFITFDDKVVLDNASFIDAIIPTTRVLIEHKSIDKDLKKAIRQSDGTLLTPYQQARRYISELPFSKIPRWVVTCNFKAFHVYDMERPGGEPEEMLLENLEKEYYRLSFLTDVGNDKIKREMEISIAAGKIVGLLYNAFAKQYIDLTNEHTMRSLNVLCVKLVFCLYADDAGVFGSRAMFHNYLAEFETKHMRKAVLDLFKVLNTMPEDRDPYLDSALATFPYVNGGLFAYEDIEVPQFTDEIKDLLLNEASANFNWSEISPTIFGAVFESTLNPETRRSGGMHYTSIENIHKVIDPLFYDDLLKEFEEICAIAVKKTKETKLREFQSNLASLTFFDPACGSGNFLTETYICLRRLENDIISELHKGQMVIGEASNNPILISINQFYGIEINDFAVTVAKTAMWIAESQMMKETENIIHMQLEYLPLKTDANVVEGNALRIDWETVFPKDKASFIMGNPPFVGGMMMNREQKAEMKDVFNNIKGFGELDYVTAWYKAAAEYMKNTSISSAFVSTNSISQGQQVVTLWKPLIESGVHINFAHRTFKWNSEASDKAAVHCVIVGFSYDSKMSKIIFNENIRTEATQINPYLVDAPMVFIDQRSDPICDVPKMRFGSMPRDGGGFILSDDEKVELISKEPLAAQWIRPYIGANEFINGKIRWCLWLVGAKPSDIAKCPTIMKRVEGVRDFRASSKAEATRKFAETPTLFCQIAQPDTDYIFVPSVSSEKRKYIPIGFMSSNIVTSNLAFLIPDASLYHFGILTSNVHMAWTRVVCGRLEMRYRYSKDIVYNNFPWPDANDEQKEKIENLAQAVLYARAEYPDSTLADMYGETSMLFHTKLLEAHRTLDHAVMALYGITKGTEAYTSESACVALLMERYQELVKDL